MPQIGYVPHPDGMTREEFAQVLSLRREALAEATKLAGLGEPLPVPWRHQWKAHVRPRGRDRDGSLLITVVVEGPRGETPHSRNYRLVPRKRLPLSLGRE